MRKLQKAMIAAAVAAGGLSAIGAGAGTAYAYGNGHDSAPKVAENYRPYQECSPQTVSENDIPIGALGLSETFDTTCGQFNNAFSG